MDIVDILQGIFRWLHVVAGIVWIGHLYFFNFVNGPFAATIDAETKKKVVPELMPRALYWFRWGAAFTWVTGVLLLLIVFYHGGALFEDPSKPNWGIGALVMLAVVFLGVFVYDNLYSGPLKDLQRGFIGGAILAALILLLMKYWAGFGYRGYSIHLGAMFGTIMAFNVWFRIWPAQQKIITATKNGEAADASLVALAGLRSRHNTYMSVPLVFVMLNQHTTTWAASPLLQVLIVAAIVPIGWQLVRHLYDIAGKVKGF
ncbi:MAG TPA: urate hydroxylase PuuD [Candidatus Binatia bacterium]|nr:urate hydroxylase PuuD [Candidatus Binatia bacterium]